MEAERLMKEREREREKRRRRRERKEKKRLQRTETTASSGTDAKSVERTTSGSLSTPTLFGSFGGDTQDVRGCF